MSENLKSNEDRYIINSVKKVLILIDTLAEHGPLNLIELSDIMELPKSSVYRNLLTLEKYNYITRTDDNQKYCLGHKFLKLAKNLLVDNVLVEKATHDMELLADKYNDTVNLGVLYRNKEIVYVKIIEGTYSLKMSDTIGTTASFHCTAIGKSISAFLPETDIDIMITKRGLPKITKNTITNKQSFLKKLNIIRNRGYSIDDEESVIGARCIAAPLFNLFDEVVGAISLSGAINRFPEDKIDYIANDVKKAAKNISMKMGNCK